MEENKVLTLEEFKEMWSHASKVRGGLIDYNIVLENIGSEIRADSYRVSFYNDEGNRLIAFYYKGYVIAIVELKNIYKVY